VQRSWIRVYDRARSQRLHSETGSGLGYDGAHRTHEATLGLEMEGLHRDWKLQRDTQDTRDEVVEK